VKKVMEEKNGRKIGAARCRFICPFRPILKVMTEMAARVVSRAAKAALFHMGVSFG
jgi:hypothetical protein